MTTTTIDSAGKHPSEYGAFAVALHWVIFFAIIALFALVNYAGSLDKTDPMRGTAMDWHKAIGTVVLGLALLRIFWNKVHGAPDLVPTSRLTDVLARISHGLLYLLLLAVPATGLGMVLSAGRGVTLLGIPPLFAPNKSLAGLLHETHETLFWVTVALVGVHVVAALWHHYIRHDSTLGRMVPWLRGKA
ncbi:MULTISPECIES: cytochrome b [Rhodopseudomonas]|uniref:Cytochrome B561 n=1 Tax=Rhodopseudomonas palustris TaxID=1076 RepID=A0A0D7DZY5_RHOPL|nr:MULTISPECIES: cytochrome b [Rhodopseudomonas]KIZ33811.1 cytochrome B561 [Rhodopseudomonas palustris]MDF3814190.1 cytochrome b [Rhodopseudomonas sp. BAL398]WOK18655.1 cytochrome b [Rhodopseudomonas sp. BAL398]